MSALTNGRRTKQRPNLMYSAPMAAAAVAFEGGIVALDASGNADAGTTALNLTCIGVAKHSVDNSDGAAGGKRVTAEKGVFAFANSAAGDLITRADIDGDAYLVDDQTVAKTNGGNTRSVAGKIMDVDADGVWIKFD